MPIMAASFGAPILKREAGMNDGSIPDALTFDDVLLLPGRSTVLPTEVDTTTSFARKVRLNVPLASAAMDTVTESRLAIAIARQGGIGIVHRSMPAEKQAEEVDRVKRSESGMIVDPVTISPDITIRQALEIMNKYKISGLPVTRGSRLTGILTNRDLRFEKNHSQLVSSVMTKENLVTVPVGTTLDEAERILQKHRIEKLLVVDQDFNLKGLITVKDIQKKLEYPRAAKDEHGRLRVGAAVGATGDFLERAVELSKAKVDVVAIDTAHGHSFRVMEAIKAIRHRLPDAQLIAGNVATYEGTKELISLGVDGLKVGIGPGSICTTRVVTGAGVPQLTAIIEAARAAQGTDVPLIADGGIKYSGDISKALAAGASCVMIGSLFAGTEESPGETILYQGRTFKSYRGMGSTGAMEAGSDRYATVQDTGERGKSVPEGVEGRVPYKGSLGALTDQLVGGLRSGMGYVGASTLKELQEKSRFIRVTAAGLRESHVHDVIITKEAPNYRME
jgi:IMP dehydrogenase